MYSGESRTCGGDNLSSSKPRVCHRIVSSLSLLRLCGFWAYSIAGVRLVLPRPNWDAPRRENVLGGEQDLWRGFHFDVTSETARIRFAAHPLPLPFRLPIGWVLFRSSTV